MDSSTTAVPRKTLAGSIDFVEEVPSLFTVCGDPNATETEGCSPDGSKLPKNFGIFFANESGQAAQPDVHIADDSTGIKRYKVVQRGNEYEYLYKYAMTSKGDLVTVKVLQYHNLIPLCKDVKKMIDPEYDASGDPQADRKCKVLWSTRLVGQYGIAVTMLKPGNRPQVVEDYFSKLPETDVNAGRIRNSSIARDLTVITADSHRVADFLTDFYQAMRPNMTQFKGCLNNSRTHAYDDIQAYVYCIVPHDERKHCFGKRINDYRMSCPIGTAPDFSEAIDHCFIGNGSNPPAKPLSNFDMSGANAWRAELFKTAFDVIPGVKDFSVASTERTLDDFFSRVGLTRLKNTKIKRVIDPDFGWIPNQPRYEVLRAKQAAYMQKELATRTPLFNPISAKSIVCDTAFLSRINEQVSGDTAAQLQGFSNSWQNSPTINN
jgi:hypothetical protein